MRPADADLIFALEDCALVVGVYELRSPPRDWPRLVVVMNDDTEYALGSVTGLIIRALPHQDRSHIGVAAEQRLRELWIPLTESLQLTPEERAAAAARAEQRRRTEPVPLPRPQPAPPERVEPPPFSIPIFQPFKGGHVWRLSNRRVVALEVQGDPFRSPAPPAAILVVTGNDQTYERIAASAPPNVKLARAMSVRLAMEAIEQGPPRRIVCDESLALGDGGLLERVEAEHPQLLGSFEVLCSEGSADWLSTYLAKRMPRIRVIEEPLLEDDIADLLERAKARS